MLIINIWPPNCDITSVCVHTADSSEMNDHNSPHKYPFIWKCRVGGGPGGRKALYSR